MDKLLVGIIVGIAIIGFAAVGLAPHDGGVLNTPGYHSQYADKDGDCFVPAQGDPLYDSYYAENVNGPNCASVVDRGKSLVLDAQARAIDAQTESKKLDNRLNGLGVAAVVLIIIMILAFIIRS